MLGNTRKNQVTRLVTLRHRSTMSGALGLEVLKRILIRDVHRMSTLFQGQACPGEAALDEAGLVLELFQAVPSSARRCTLRLSHTSTTIPPGTW